MVSIVIPAHNEARVIGRLLDGLLGAAEPGELDIVVVPNGCTDATAQVAASYGPSVRVVESSEASKAAALRIGDEAARGFPRLYVDADVELGTADVRALADALERPEVAAAAPSRRLDMTGRPWPVRSYYRVWTRLPEVRRGLFGRGVVAVTERGHARLAALPRVIADDLASSLAFGPAERTVVASAAVTVHPPRTLADLLRRRERAAAGVEQLERADLDQAGGSARTTPSDLLAMLRREPSLAPHLAVFLSITVLARARQARRRGNYTAWQRDESSRT
ncbi:glycosyltransferase [Actinomadura sp. NEAU-AAG5]|uniref:4,4'-diaponeurosporenoate glycosyltransferase n=1 Tax=Actinomadura litoris TaxID=2678616 RepID=A0A7K1KY88_9ACTN|nr:glycosyltransferase [Actinomadura litoris]